MEERNQENEISKDISELILDPELQNAIDDIPDENSRRLISERIVAITKFSMIANGENSSENSLAKKMTPEHITTFLSTQEKEMELGFQEKTKEKIFFVVILLIMSIFILILIRSLKSTPELLKEIVIALISGTSGLLAGYGYGKNKD